MKEYIKPGIDVLELEVEQALLTDSVDYGGGGLGNGEEWD